MNWALLAKLMLLVSFALGGMTVWSGLQCTFRIMNGAEITVTTDVGQVQASGGFFTGITTGGPLCMKGSIIRAADWQKYGSVAALGLFFLLTWIDGQEYKRRIRKAAQLGARDNKETTEKKAATEKKPATSKNVSIRTISAPVVSGPQKAVTSRNEAAPSRPTTERSPAVSATNRAVKTAGPLYDPLYDPTHAAGIDRAPGAVTSGSRPAATQRSNAAPGRNVESSPRSKQTAAFSLADEEWGDDSNSLAGQMVAALTRDEVPLPPVRGAGGPQSGSRVLNDTLASFGADSGARPFSARTIPPHKPGLSALDASDDLFPPMMQPEIRVFKSPTFTRVAGELEVALAVANAQSGTLERVRVTGVVTGPRGRKLAPFKVELSQLPQAATFNSTGRAKFGIPPHVWSAGLSEQLSREGGAYHVELTVALEGDEQYASSELADSLTLALVGTEGLPLTESLALLHSTDGAVLRVSIGSESPGMLRVSPIPLGNFELEFEDDLRILSEGGRAARRAAVLPDGMDALKSGMSLEQAGIRELMVMTPIIRYVAAGARGDGTADNPLGDLQRAVQVAVHERNRLGRPCPVEVRVSALGVAPSHRPGIVGGARGPWIQWWRGAAADRRDEWTVDLAQLRELPHADELGEYIDGEYLFEEIHDLRIVNRAFVDLRRRAAIDPDLSERLDHELGQLPQAVFRTTSPGGGFQFRFVGCKGLRLEGLHFVGQDGVSGVSLENCQQVLVQRCWFERFVNGPTANPSMRASGRAMHVTESGTEKWQVELVECDFGWNTCARPRMPVRGAALASHDSWVILTRCLIHDNVASDEPADILATGTGQVVGDSTNHSAGNLVVAL